MLRGKPELLDNTFLKYCFIDSFVQDQLHSRISGTTVTGIKQSELRKVSLRFPPLPEQKAIAQVLAGFDDKIELNRRMNATLEAMAQTLFRAWFVDFEPVKAKAAGVAPVGLDAETAALFPSELVASTCGLIPQGWGIYEADKVAKVGIGKTPPRKEPQWFSTHSNHVPWISIRDMGICGTYVQTTSEFLTREAISRFNVRQIPDNTVLLSFKLTIGRVAITDGEMTSNEAIAHFVLPPSSILTTEYLYLYLQQFEYSVLGSTSSIATAVNSVTIRQMPILVPSQDIMLAFNNTLAPIFTQMKINLRKSRTLAQLRDSLLPRLVAGQLRVER